MTDYSSKSMTEQAVAIHENQVSPTILLEQFFENIEKEPNSKNIFSEIFYKDALSEAKNSEDRQKKGRRKSFFDGIVINWKDLFDINKKKCEGGTQLLSERVSEIDSDVYKIAKVRILQLAKHIKQNLHFLVLELIQRSNSLIKTNF